MINHKDEYSEEYNAFMRTIEAYNLQDRVFELRILNPKVGRGILSGYYDNPVAAFNDIKGRWKKETIYVSLQKLDKAVIARSCNRLTYAKNTTSEKDVKAYIFLHIDIDPIRPSGIQATKEERAFAKKKIKDVISFLKEFGFGSPVISMSGNGYTADYYLEELSVNKENKELIKTILQTLDILFSDDKAAVDTSVCDAPRIVKFVGTISKKGNNVEDRPYTYSKIMRLPENRIRVTRQQLAEVASLKEDLSNDRKS